MSSIVATRGGGAGGQTPVVVVPAYQPEPRLLELLQALAGTPVVVVDDGSSAAAQPIFEAAAALPHVELLQHAVNLGKGAALRTGINHALCRHRGAPGVVTADADGQHAAADVRRVAAALGARPEALTLGVREFSSETPLRSRFGNKLTRSLFHYLQGSRLRDTQSGLRGIPRDLAITMLSSPAGGYEFELDMLIVARTLSVPIEQIPIQTLYFEGNRASHFDPLRDSMRIYFLLLRSVLASLLTALCDNVVFLAMLALVGSPLPAQIVARAAALGVNYQLNRRVVFLVRRSSRGIWLRYLLVVAGSGVISYLSLTSLHRNAGVPLAWAKVAVESILFFANFLLLRDFVFVRSGAISGPTDWTSYYQRVPVTARATRIYTTRALLSALERGRLAAAARPVIVELGGGNSCFLDPIRRRFEPRVYHVVDTNPLGLELLRDRQWGGLELHRVDALSRSLDLHADLVFSVGFVEHFDRAGTARAIAAHFDNARPGGLVLISAPRPTWLYRVTRWLLEQVGLWSFPDERALEPEEIAATASRHGDLVLQRTLWWVVLTQHLMLYRRH